MIVFTVTLIQGYGTERTLIFSSLEKIQEWKNSYKTDYFNYSLNGEELAVVEEIIVDENKVLSTIEEFTPPIEDPDPEELDWFND